MVIPFHSTVLQSFQWKHEPWSFPNACLSSIFARPWADRVSTLTPFFCFEDLKGLNQSKEHGKHEADLQPKSSQQCGRLPLAASRPCFKFLFRSGAQRSMLRYRHNGPLPHGDGDSGLSCFESSCIQLHPAADTQKAIPGLLRLHGLPDGDIVVLQHLPKHWSYSREAQWSPDWPCSERKRNKRTSEKLLHGQRKGSKRMLYRTRGVHEHCATLQTRQEHEGRPPWRRSDKFLLASAPSDVMRGEHLVRQ